MPTQGARVTCTPSERLDGLAEEWSTLNFEDERDNTADEFLDDIEDVLNATGRYVAFSDGGGTGDWILIRY